VCKDTLKDYPGPLAGLISLMDYSDADYFLVSPCDTPRLSPVFGQTMLTFLSEQLLKDSTQPYLIAVCSGNKQQPLHLCISRAYQTSLKSYLQSGQHKVMQWMSENGAKWLDFPDTEDIFKNYNRLDDLQSG
jgi:molybdopterin-guanine dinucleotide biosynthesis protein A